ncbi:unnamed protein product [Ixodes pacificus]
MNPETCAYYISPSSSHFSLLPRVRRRACSDQSVPRDRRVRSLHLPDCHRRLWESAPMLDTA